MWANNLNYYAKRRPLICGRLDAPSRQSLNDEGRFESHGP